MLTFDRHFNPDLENDSTYFKTLADAMKCVEKNAGVAPESQDKVCAKEFKKLRLQAFNNKIFYHFIFQKHFQNELAIARNESPL